MRIRNQRETTAVLVHRPSALAQGGIGNNYYYFVELGRLEQQQEPEHC